MLNNSKVKYAQPDDPYAQLGDAPNLDRIYSAIDPAQESYTGWSKFFRDVWGYWIWSMCFWFPYFDKMIREKSSWGYNITSCGLIEGYCLVLIFNVIIPTLLVQGWLGFRVVGSGRKIYSYKVPVMNASVDIHALDVLNGGNVLSKGNAKLARQRLWNASTYSCHQRTHQNALESFPMFLVLSLLGGMQYPFATSLWGLGWCVGRITWTRGYLTSNPISRYSNPLSILVWAALLGVLCCTSGFVVECFFMKS